MTPLRTRYAPSPTGLAHIGNLRAALFSYLLAKQSGGQFILRVEDTDRERLVPEALGLIIESLSWLGLAPDEGPKQGGKFGPYVQSERLKLYQDHADQLIKAGLAYRDYTSSEDLATLRETAEAAKQPFRFAKTMAQLKPVGDEPSVVRFEIPPGPAVTWNDAVWGPQSWEREVLDDFVCLKSDGYPTYNFANVVDDHLMEITTVLRGQEFLPTTPKNILAYAALGWEVPRFAHLPWIMGPDKTKLSKRHGAKSALELRDEGYLPEVIINFLALLGWNPGTEQEIFSLPELIKNFDLNRVQKSNAVFDPTRLDWMNGEYLRAMKLEDLVSHIKPWLAKANLIDDQTNPEYLAATTALIHERIKRLNEAPELMDFFFHDPKPSLEILTAKHDRPTLKNQLQATLEALEATPDWSHDPLEATLRALVTKLDTKPGDLFYALRVTLTGKTAAPGLFETLEVLGRDRSTARLKQAIKIL